MVPSSWANHCTMDVIGKIQKDLLNWGVSAKVGLSGKLLKVFKHGWQSLRYSLERIRILLWQWNRGQQTGEPGLGGGKSQRLLSNANKGWWQIILDTYIECCLHWVRQAVGYGGQGRTESTVILRFWTWWLEVPYTEIGRSEGGVGFRARWWAQLEACCVCATQGDAEWPKWCHQRPVAT